MKSADLIAQNTFRWHVPSSSHEVFDIIFAIDKAYFINLTTFQLSVTCTTGVV